MSILNTTQELESLFENYELCRAQTCQVKLLRRKLEDGGLTIAVIGQFKRGKTTLVNNILGEELLPVGIVPITAAVTRIRYGEKKALVIFENGLQEEVELSALSQYISEQENRENRLGVAEVQLFTESEFLKNGLVLVDTPGVGSVHEKNSQTAYDFVKESDGVVFLLSVDSPINKIERLFLERVKHYAGKFYFAVNKTDIIDEGERAEYLAYCQGFISGLMQREDIKLFPLSAKKGKGVAELKAAMEKDMAKEAEVIVEESVRLKLMEILKNTRLQIGSYRNVLNMAPNVFDSRFREMGEILRQLRKENKEPDESVCAGVDVRLLPVTALNEKKNYLKLKVRELFGIEYYYDIEISAAMEKITPEEYAIRAERIYTELEDTLNTIFMYKEENAYTVARRIEDLNILMRKMDRYYDRLLSKNKHHS